MRGLALNGKSAKAVKSVGQLDVERDQIWPAAAGPFRAAFSGGESFMKTEAA
jgi:hypothetical protein